MKRLTGIFVLAVALSTMLAACGDKVIIYEGPTPTTELKIEQTKSCK